MNKEFNVKELISRLGYFRTKRNLSQREVSARLGYSDTWYYRVENGEIDLRMSIVFELMELFEITPMELFYYDVTKFAEDKELLEQLQQSSPDNKKAISQLLKSK